MISNSNYMEEDPSEEEIDVGSLVSLLESMPGEEMESETPEMEMTMVEIPAEEIEEDGLEELLESISMMPLEMEEGSGEFEMEECAGEGGGDLVSKIKRKYQI